MEEPPDSFGRVVPRQLLRTIHQKACIARVIALSLSQTQNEGIKGKKEIPRDKVILGELEACYLQQSKQRGGGISDFVYK